MEQLTYRSKRSAIDQAMPGRKFHESVRCNHTDAVSRNNRSESAARLHPNSGNFFNVRFTSNTIAADLLADVGADVIVFVRLITIDYNLGKSSLKITRVNGDIRELPIALGSSITVSGSIIELQSSVHGPGCSGAIAGCIKVN